jgi:hypothetical protein
MSNTTKYDFATMTAAEALDILVDLDVAKWGEGEREASRGAATTSMAPAMTPSQQRRSTDQTTAPAGLRTSRTSAAATATRRRGRRPMLRRRRSTTQRLTH